MIQYASDLQLMMYVADALRLAVAGTK